MSIPLQYDFEVVGFQRVDHALRSVERRVIASNKRMSRSLGVTHRESRKPTHRSDVGRGFAQIAKVAEREEIKRHRQAMRHRQRETQTHLKGIASIGNAARREEMRRHKQAMRDAQAERAARSKWARSTVGNVGRRVSGTTRAIGATATGLVGIGGGMLFGSAFNSEKRNVAAATELANKALGTPGEVRGRSQLQKDILSGAKAQGLRSGLGTEGAIEAMRQFVGISGNMRAAEASLPYMVDIANATGASVGDVGRTGGQIAQAIFARDPDAATDPKKMAKALGDVRSIMGSMAGQAKVGSIEFADLAQQMGKVMSATAGFEGDIGELATTMGAIAQLSIAGGSSSPEEAMTAIMRFRDDMVSNWSKFKDLSDSGGVDVFTDKTQTRMRAPEQILMDMLESTGGNLPTMGKLYGKRAKKAAEPFQEAFVKAGGGEEGMAAVRKMLNNIRGSKMSDSEVRESAAFRVSQTDRQFDKAMEQFRQAVGDDLLPAVTKLIPAFVKLTPVLERAANMFAKFIDALVENPVGTIGKIIATKVALDIATANIGGAIKSGVAGAFSGNMPKFTGVGTSAASGATAGGLASAAGMGLSLGAMTAASILVTGIARFENAQIEDKQAGKTTLKGLESKDPTVVREALRKLEGETGELKKDVDFEIFGVKILKGIDSLLGGVKQEQIATREGMIEQLREHLAALPDAAQKLSSAADRMGNGGSGSPNRSADPTMPRSGG